MEYTIGMNKVVDCIQRITCGCVYVREVTATLCTIQRNVIKPGIVQYINSEVSCNAAIHTWFENGLFRYYV